MPEEERARIKRRSPEKRKLDLGHRRRCVKETNRIVCLSQCALVSCILSLLLKDVQNHPPLLTVFTVE